MNGFWYEIHASLVYIWPTRKKIGGFPTTSIIDAQHLKSPKCNNFEDETWANVESLWLRAMREVQITQTMLILRW
jgi:hypothetical protein